MGGNGRDQEAYRDAQRIRRSLEVDGQDGHFLQGVMHESLPLYMPGLEERYEPVPGDGPPGDVIAVRNDVAQPGEEIITLRYWRIDKGTFDDFLRLSVESAWPFYEKLGARIVGQWKVIYPEPVTNVESPDYNVDNVDSPDYDEVYQMTRYASYAHWEATRPGESVLVGGNGPDWETMMEAVLQRQSLTRETSVQFLQGYFYRSPPVFMPGLGERYRSAN